MGGFVLEITIRVFPSSEHDVCVILGCIYDALLDVVMDGSWKEEWNQ